MSPTKPVYRQHRYKVKTWGALAQMGGRVHVTCKDCQHDRYMDAWSVCNQVGDYRPLVDPVFRCWKCGSRNYHMLPFFAAFY